MKHAAATRVCFVADDFGLHDHVDQAIRMLVEAGRLQALGCLVGGRSWLASAPMLREVTFNTTDRGLHFDLTEHPLTLAPSRLPRLIARAYCRALSAKLLRAEIRAQLSAFELAVGRVPDYVDGHQHVHQLPVVRDALLDELDTRYGCAERPWLRSTLPAWNIEPRARPTGREGRKAGVIAALGGLAFSQQAAQRGYNLNNGFLGVYGFDRSEPEYLDLLKAWLTNAKDGSLLMCHPACGTVPDDPIARARTVEFSILAGEAVPKILNAAGIVPATLGNIIRTSNTHPNHDHGRIARADSEQSP